MTFDFGVSFVGQEEDKVVGVQFEGLIFFLDKGRLCSVADCRNGMEVWKYGEKRAEPGGTKQRIFRESSVGCREEWYPLSDNFDIDHREGYAYIYRYPKNHGIEYDLTLTPDSVAVEFDEDDEKPTIATFYRNGTVEEFESRWSEEQQDWIPFRTSTGTFQNCQQLETLLLRALTASPSGPTELKKD